MIESRCKIKKIKSRLDSATPGIDVRTDRPNNHSMTANEGDLIQSITIKAGLSATEADKMILTHSIIHSFLIPIYM